jgi:SAM-dependent methyltransferase/ribosomal protein L37E
MKKLVSEAKMIKTNSANQDIYDVRLNKCVACGYPDIQFWKSKSYAYTTGRDETPFDIFRCRQCGTGFLNPPPSDSCLDAIYSFSGHGLREPMTFEEIMKREKQTPNSTIDARTMIAKGDSLNLSGNKTALDIGAGYGFFSRELIQRGYRVTAVNPAGYENKIFEEMNQIKPLDIFFEDFQTDTKYGIILMSQSLEHIKSPSAIVQKVSNMLSDGGVLICAVPNFHSFPVRLWGTRDNGCLWVPEHVNFFTLKGLYSLFHLSNLDVCFHQNLTRISDNYLSKKAKWLDCKAIRVFVKYAQIPFAVMVNRIRMGICIHIYGRRKIGVQME